MNHREFFDLQARDWDVSLDERKTEGLNRIVAMARVFPGARVLDVGTGTGIMIPLLQERLEQHGSIVAIDLSYEMLARARENITRDTSADGRNMHALGSASVDFIQADVMHLPLVPKEFDSVICFACYPHFPDKQRAIGEMATCLKPAGRIVIAHTMGREALNAMHRGIGCVVANDQLPPTECTLSMMKRTGFGELQAIEEEKFYALSGVKHT
jgi:ubiquinone/menaquinone biosynthesis C-methylase UbiE